MLIYITHSLFSRFPISLSIHLPLSFVRSFIMVLYSSSSAHLFLLTRLSNSLFHPSPNCAPIQPRSSTLDICRTHSLIHHIPNISFVRKCGVIFWVMTQTLAMLENSKSHMSLSFSLLFPSLSVALYIPPLACSIHACQQSLLYHVEAPRLKAN